jgi:hypothetical protein
MVLVHESDPRFGAFDFRAAREKAPPDLQDMLDNHESLPFRRRGYERDGMLQTLIEHAGFKALLEGARASATNTSKQLAKVPNEIEHVDLESFHDRPVQMALVELLLLPKQDKRFTSCVVMHGMGGTGKTVTAVAVVQETTVREHFTHIYWLTVGADAVGEKIRQLQAAMHKQLTGKGMSSAEVQQKDEQEWLGMLVEAMTMDRSLVVLDDPWLPEQVRFLNPVDGTQTDHRLLVTTRIRGLAHSRATCIELSMMDKDEAVALMLDVAGVTKLAYKNENPGSQWPPPAAYGLAVECGLLPITLTITAQLVRSWGKGWEKAVLPLLREEHGAGSGRGATTVEERIIGAGLKSLKGEDAPATKALFGMFAVTQEDFVHPMAVIELLWRCCRPSTEKASGLSARLKVRQWTQVLIDQSLLLGSSSKGVHVHDIVLTYLRGTQSASELQALQKRVVEGLVAASMERVTTTGRGFQDTGSTAKAFEGEEVDWYVCNVASYHVKQSIDPSLALAANVDVKRLVLADDETIVRAAAVAVGMVELELLLAHYSAAEEWIEAAKVGWAMGMVSGGNHGFQRHGKAALGLLVKAESVTAAAQQLELDMRGALAYFMRTGPEKKQNTGKIQELMARNSSLQMDPMDQYSMSITPRIFALFGFHPKLWDAGKIATADTIAEGFRLQIYEGMPLRIRAVEESVGARKECIRFGSMMLQCCINYLVMNRSTDETAEMHQQLLDEKWGRDGSILAAGCMEYSFDRHHAIAKGVGSRLDYFMIYASGQAVAEHCGDVQQMVQLFEKQLGAMQEYIRSGVSEVEIGLHCIAVPGSFVGLELEALHPFGKDFAALFASWRCTDPSECREWYESAAWAGWRARYGHVEGLSSKDGAHHMISKPTIISGVQAVLSLSQGSTGSSSFDLSWLDGLPAADDSKLHDCGLAHSRMVNSRVLIAEVFEQQRRHKEAIRCAILPMAHTSMCSHTSCICNLAALQQPRYKTTSTSPLRRRCVQGGCSADATLRLGSMPSRCQLSMRLSSWRGVGDICCQRRWRCEAGRWQVEGRARSRCTGASARGSISWRR